MGLFDKKKKGSDDFEGPVEEVSLTAEPPSPAERGQSRGTASSAISQPQAAEPQPAARRPAPEPESPMNFGINRAIELMRLLPADNIELVVKVVKTTLESTNVKISTIIEDATRKQGDIDGRVGVLKKEILELEAEIATRKGEITTLEADHAETTTVKERLMLAEKLSASRETDQKKSGAPGASPTDEAWK